MRRARRTPEGFRGEYCFQFGADLSLGLLKEYLVGVEVFDRGLSFAPRTDSLVRVEAGRLRSKLRDYYDRDGRADRVLIALPKGGYAPRWTRWIALLALLLGAYYFYSRWRKPPMTSLAVLRFENLTGDPRNDQFCQGLEDELTAALAKVKGLRVMLPGRPGGRLRPEDAARQWQAGAVVQGSLRRSGDRVRVTVQLVRLSDHSNVWAETYDRQVQDAFALHSEIARAIAAGTRARLLPEP